jgi:predicted CopG family antitoxin
MKCHHSIMIKTQIQLEDWQYSSLKKAGAEAGRSLSDVIRESVSLFLKSNKKKETTPLQELAGKYSSRSIEDLKAHDRAWAESIR